MRKITLLFLAFLLISCSDASLSNEDLDSIRNTSYNEDLDSTSTSQINSASLTNLDLIQENLEIYLNSKTYSERLDDLYYCSEELGNYPNKQILTKGYYINSLNVPNPNAAKFPDLQSLLTYRYHNDNASGNNNRYIYISFEVLGANGAGYLNIVEANRVYNEFICQLGIGNSRRVSFKLNFSISYYLCCTGSSCCNPIFEASGRIYWN